MKKIIISLSLILSLSAFAQSNARYSEYGLDRVKYNNIVSNLEPLFQKNPSRSAAIDLGEAFFYLRKLEKALMYYEIALLDGPLNEFHSKNYFLALYENGDTKIARKIGNEFAVRFQKGSLLAQMDSVESWKLQEPVYFEKNSVVNTANNEYGLLTFYDNFKFLNTDFTYDRYATVRNFSPYVINHEDTVGGRIKYIPIAPRTNTKYDIISHYDMELDKVYITRTEPGIVGIPRSRILIGTVDNNFNLVDVQEFSTHYKFSVSDNGIGIEKEYFDKIFKIFHSLNENKESTGIGLSIVKKIVSLYNGEVWLDSKPGEGTTFYFTIKK